MKLELCPNGCSVLGLGGVSVMTPKGPIWLVGHSSSCPALEVRDKTLWIKDSPK